MHPLLVFFGLVLIAAAIADHGAVAAILAVLYVLGTFYAAARTP